MTIQLEENSKNGRAFLRQEGETKAEMTFTKPNDKFIIVDHTEVDDSLRGQGVGRKLLAEIVGYARKNKVKIMPLCPYAKSVFDKDESIRDVLR